MENGRRRVSKKDIAKRSKFPIAEKSKVNEIGPRTGKLLMPGVGIHGLYGSGGRGKEAFPSKLDRR